MTADRRVRPRRREEAALHYAEQTLIAAALDCAVVIDPDLTGWAADVRPRCIANLQRAADGYRLAERELHDANLLRAAVNAGADR